MQQRTPFPRLARVRPWWLLVVTVALSALGLPSPAQEAPPEKAVIRLTSPKPGMTFDAPGPIAFQGYAIDPAGDIRHLEFFANELPIGSSDFLSKIATIPGMTIPHHLVWEGIAPGSYKVVARGRDSLGNPVESETLPVEVTRPASGRFQFVSSGAEWRYHNDGTDLGQKWRDPAFEDRSWPSGPSELGYGDGDEKTVTRTDGAPHPLTAYFLHTFLVPADLNVARLEIRLVRDDGAVVYLNGKELLRDNLPDGEITFTTPASDSTENENRVRRFQVPADALVAGPNLLAVEVHQASPSSSDLSFDLQLIGLSSDTPSPLTPTVSLVGLNLATSESRPEARIAPGRISLRRTGDLTRDLAVFLAISGTASPDLDFSALANPALIPAGKAEVDLEIIALDDDLVEPTETVVVEIVPSPVAGPLPSYEADPEHARAAVEIRDADSPGVIAPVVSLVGLNLATSEPRPEARIAPGRLALRRTGDT
ncbi:MAG: hypothetical protein IT580_11675, partial [Verrucomicrobiales bacterium]|nr:hypothetical protein [Verrucomicrobiales bacterium]